jgi:GNAT superfamily N-acetyltransferase
MMNLTNANFIENSLTYQEYVSLRSSVGWNNFAQEQVVKSIRNSIYDIKVVVENRTIAMGRLIGDGTYYLVVDIVVQPEYQGRGIGSKIVDSIIKYVEDNTPNGGRSSVQLIAEQGKEAFYEKKGFKRIPHEFCGSGMRKIIRN